jgi:hypothetical protein
MTYIIQKLKEKLFWSRKFLEKQLAVKNSKPIPSLPNLTATYKDKSLFFLAELQQETIHNWKCTAE